MPVLQAVAIIGTADDSWQAFVAQDRTPLPALAATVEEDAAEEEERVSSKDEERRSGTAAESRLFASPRARKLASEKGVDLASLTATGPGGRIIEKDVIAYLSARPKASPLARRLAEDSGVDVFALAGTGPGGWVTQKDVEMALTAKAQSPEPPLAPLPAPLPASAAARQPAPRPLPEADVLERIPLKGVRGIIAERMAASVHTTARVTLVTEVDASEFVEVRNRLKASIGEAWGFAPGYNDLLALIVAKALRRFPYMNARLVDNAIEHLAHIQLGMAVDTERGLLVPVLRDADTMSLRTLGATFRELVDKVRRNRLSPDELFGGTFTITNLGMYDIDAFTPVINLPEVAILGVGRIAPKPVVRDGVVVVRQMWTLSLVFDHRLVDGAPAARFLQFIKQMIEEPYLLLAE